MVGGRVSFSDTTVSMSKIRVQFYGKVAPAACTQSTFRLGKVKTSVDQSAQLISRWIKMGTLLCRQMARVHPGVSFAHFFLLSFFFERKNPTSCDCTEIRTHVPTSEGFEVTYRTTGATISR